MGRPHCYLPNFKDRMLVSKMGTGAAGGEQRSDAAEDSAQMSKSDDMTVPIEVTGKSLTDFSGRTMGK